MTKKDVDVKVNVAQVRDGEEYRGEVIFDKHIFRYQLRLGMRPDRLYGLKNNPEDLFRQFHFDVTDSEGRSVELDDKTKKLFIATAGQLALDFYNNPQTRNLNEVSMASLGLGATLYENPDMSINIGMSTEYKFPRIPELEKFLELYRE